MLIPIFTLKFNQKVIPRTVTVGNYDGKHPSITAATSAGKVRSVCQCIIFTADLLKYVFLFVIIAM